MTKIEKAEQISACFLTPAFLQFKHNKFGVRLEAKKKQSECLISNDTVFSCQMPNKTKCRQKKKKNRF